MIDQKGTIDVMKKTIAVLAAVSLLAVSLPACAKQTGPTAASEQTEPSASFAEMVYGTMEIPYSAFYAAEGPASEVDAVTSATNSKWNSPSFASGAYSAAHADDDGGDILGVVYPVAIEKDALEALGENNYGFAALDETPEAYKAITVDGNQVSFSAVNGAENALEAEAVFTTDTVWGDYQIEINAIHNQDGKSDIGVVAGALLQCTDGSVYAMRHLENIWLDKLGWSSGIRTVEPHGNTLRSEMYADIMGKTIQTITYITDTGYHTIAVDIYVPYKFVGGVTVENAAAAAGTTVVTFDSFPEDYAVEGSVDGLNIVLNGTELQFTDAIPGAYTLKISDAGGKYAFLTASFVLSTDELPVVFDASSCTVVEAEGADEAAAAAFLKNITTVTINDTAYAASGRGAVAIIDRNGAVDLEAALVSGRGEAAVSTPIFTAGESYSVTVEAAGFPALSFTLNVQ